MVIEKEPRVRRVILRDLQDLAYRAVREDMITVREFFQSGEDIDILSGDVRLLENIDAGIIAEWMKDYHPDIRTVLTRNLKNITDNPNNSLIVYPVFIEPYTKGMLSKQIIKGLLKEI